MTMTTRTFSHAEAEVVAPGTWQRATLVDGQLDFASEEGLVRAFEDGFFLVKQPDGADLSAGDAFAQNFYLPRGGGEHDIYRGFRGRTPETIAPREGYFERSADQTEQFFLERAYWRGVYPEPLVVQAEAMRTFALSVLRAVLLELDLPEALWDEGTGQCLSDRGTYHLTFNHFRPTVRARGLNIHKDSGWVTILRSIEPGLQVLRRNVWTRLDPVPGYFVVNFGCAMEMLMRKSRTPVAAVAHRVAEQVTGDKPDRFSYALFVDSSLDETVSPGLFRYEPGRGLVFEMPFALFVDEIVKNTYQPHTAGLYRVAKATAEDAREPATDEGSSAAALELR